MNRYLQTTSDQNLLICIDNNVWGAQADKLRHWRPGDEVFFQVDRRLTARANVTGASYRDDTPLWPDRTYPYRIAIRFTKIVSPEHRIDMGLDEIRRVLAKHHTRAWGVILVLNKSPLHDEVSAVLSRHLETCPDWKEVDIKRALAALPGKPSRLEEEKVKYVTVTAEEAEEDTHTRIQYFLAKFGRSLGMSVWIPKRDWAKECNDIALKELSLSQLPSLPFGEKVARIVGEIDVIWFRRGSPFKLFEVERTTAVHSGLLRMADLMALVPFLDIGMYICAPASRKGKVLEEVNRPTFSALEKPLHRACRFISFEALEDFMRAKGDVLHRLKASVLDDISESCGLRD